MNAQQGARRRRQRGNSLTEYAALTGFMLGALLVPINGKTAIQWLLDALQREHAGFLYAAGLPGLPRGEGFVDVIPPGSGSGSTGGTSSGGTPGGMSGNAAGGTSGGTTGDGTATGGSGGGSGGSGGGGGAGGGTGSGGGTAGGSTVGGTTGGAAGGGTGSGTDGDGGATTGGGGGTGGDGTGGSTGSGDGGGSGTGGDGDGGGGSGDDGPGNGGPQACAAPDPGQQQSSWWQAALASASQPTGIAATHVGNPIHVVTGNKYQRETDLTLPGGFGFERHYNSRSRHRGILGANWRHGFETVLVDEGHRIRLWQSDGRRIDFVLTREAHGARFYEAAQHGDGSLTANKAGYDWSWRNGTQLAFNRERQLRTITDASGRTTRLIRDRSGRVTQIEDARQRRLQLDYDGQGRLQSLRDPGGLETRYAYDARGNLARVDYADGTTRLYHYEDPHDTHNLTGISISALAGEGRAATATRIVTWAYDARDRAIAFRPADPAQHVDLIFDKGHTRVANAQGQTSIYRTGVINDIPTVQAIEGPGCSPCSAEGNLTYAYNERAQLTDIRRADGVSSAYTYDDRGRTTAIHETAITGETRLLARYLYRGDEDQPAAILAPSIAPDRYHSFFLDYDAQGKPTNVIETGWTPDFEGGWLGMERRYPYHRASSGRELRGEGEPNPTPAHLQHDIYGRVIERTDTTGTTRYAYDARGRIREVIRNADTRQAQATTLTYDPLGRIAAVTGPKGTARAEYGDDGQLERIVGPDGHVLHIPQTREQDAGPEYDAAGRLRRLTDATGVVTTFAYDPFGNLIRRIRAAGTAQAATETLAYDPQGRLVAVTDPRGNTAHRQYDDFGKLLYESTPDAGMTLYRYDDQGRLIATVDEAGIIRSFHAKPGAAAASDSSTGARTTFVRQRFDDAGRVVARESESQGTEYTYDDYGRVIRQSVHLIGLEKPFVTRYRYDDTGRITRKTLPDGTRLRYRYDDQGRFAGIERVGWMRNAEIIGIVYDDQGRPARQSGPDGQTTRYTYDDRGRVETIAIPDIARWRYTYDARGQISGIAAHDGESRYHYDLLGRLTVAETPEGKTEWTYDRNGNRLAQSHEGMTTRYVIAPDSNRILATQSEILPVSADPTSRAVIPAQAGIQQDYAYDSTGRPLKRGDLRYEYTAQGRPKAIYRNAQKIADYAYDAYGQRIRKTVYGNEQVSSSTWFLYEAGRLSTEIDEQGNVRRQYLYHQHRPVALIERGARYAIHADYRGAPIAVADESGRVLWRADYDAFGQVRINEDPDRDGRTFTLNLRLPGQYADAETGTYYNLHRDYDPEAGRYLTPDPIGIADGLNTYTYVNSDPLSRVDPYGTYGIDVHYYVTYFLGVVSGLPFEEVEVIALATQFVDDNATTQPVPTVSERVTLLLALTGAPGAMAMAWNTVDRLTDAWDAYHFTLDYDYGNRGDRTDATLHRFKDPGSDQLSRLRRAALDGAHACRPNPQLFGEYLHALEDSFAHRDSLNTPYSGRSNFDNLPSREVGHANLSDFGRTAHRPDHTHNQYYFTEVDDPNISGGPWYQVEEEWAYNELRTLEMQRTVFSELKAYAGRLAGAGVEVRPPYAWRDVAGDGDARIGVPDLPDHLIHPRGIDRPAFYKPAQGDIGVLQKFNSIDIDAVAGDTGQERALKKAEMLNGWLGVRQLRDTGEYNESKARSNRRHYLKDLDPDDPAYEGLILETE